MALTPNIPVTKMTEAQNLKFVTFNEAMQLLGVLAQCVIYGRDTAPPATAEGRVCIVIATATGDFAGEEDNLAHYVDGQWEFYTPLEGWYAYVQDEDRFYLFDGSAWVAPPKFHGQLASAPSAGISEEGDTYWNTASPALWIYLTTTWTAV